MAQQSSNGGRPKLSEKGLLTPDNCVVALIDHQPQMLFGTSNFDRQTIINNTVALAKGRQSVRRAGGLDDGGNEVLQRKPVAAAKSGVSETGADRAFFDELVGRQELCRRNRTNRAQEDCPGRALD